MAGFSEDRLMHDRLKIKKQLLEHEKISYASDVIELPEEEMGMGSELVSCMPGFIASIFDVICQEAGNDEDDCSAIQKHA